MKRIGLMVGCLLLWCTPATARCGDVWCAMCARNYGVPEGFMLIDGPGYGTVVQIPVIDSTRSVVVRAMLREANIQPTDLLYDIGCGDGRILIEAVRRYGCQAVGIEIDPLRAELARQNVRASGLGRIRIVEGDARRYIMDDRSPRPPDVVLLYLDERLIAELAPRISRLARIVSSSHPIPGG